MSLPYDVGYTLGKGVRKVGETGYKAYSKATSGLPSWVKGLLIAGGIGGGLYIGYVAVNTLVGGGTSADCSNPNSPCYQALQAYQQNYQTCANQYSSYLNQFLTENAANGTAFTSSQLSTLNYLTNCMDNAAANIAATAKQYQPKNYLGECFIIGTAIISTAIAGYIGVKALAYLKTIKTPIANGGSAGSGMMNVATRYYADTGLVPTDEVTGYAMNFQTQVPEWQSFNSSYWTQLADQGIVDTTIAAGESTTINYAISGDADVTLTLLGV